MNTARIAGLLLALCLVARVAECDFMNSKKIDVEKLDKEWMDEDEDDDWHEDTYEWRQQMRAKKQKPFDPTKGGMPPLGMMGNSGSLTQMAFAKLTTADKEKTQELAGKWQGLLSTAGVMVNTYDIEEDTILFTDDNDHMQEIMDFVLDQPEVTKFTLDSRDYFPDTVEAREEKQRTAAEKEEQKKKRERKKAAKERAKKRAARKLKKEKLKNRKGKKGKKGKKAEPEPEPEPSEFDTMDIETLRERIADLKNKLEVAQLDRNQVQLDRDTIQTFYDISRKEVRDYDMAVMAKDREMEIMEDNHRVEVRVYVQKVKHLEYEHKNALARVTSETKSTLFEETDSHTDRESDLRAAKRALKMELKENELVNSKEIKAMRQAHDKNLQKLRSEFNKQLQQLREKHEGRVRELQGSLELRRKVEIHEIEERKNLHINDLLRNHEEAFGEIKKYYNDITRDNLKIIKRLKNEVSVMTAKAATNQQLMMKIAQENKQLSEPLKSAVKKVESLQNDLKDAEKDKMSLKNAKARLRVMDRQIGALEGEHKQLEAKYDEVERDRDDLYTNFEGTVKAVQRKSHLKNLVLGKRVDGMLQECDEKEDQLASVLEAANMDPAVMSMVSQRMDDVLDGRNSQIKNLEFAVARVTKAHNDVLRVYEAKLSELGVPLDEEEFHHIGPLTGGGITTGPAGLVVKPTT